MMKIVIVTTVLLVAAACGGVANRTNDVAPTVSPTAAVNLSAVSTVAIDSADGVRLAGSMYSAAKPNSPALLMLHQWQSDRHSYDDFAKRMQDRGFAVLSIDGRGFGGSTKKADGSAIAAGRTDADVKAMLGDVDAAFNYLSKQPNVDPERIGIIGASYGSSLAIIYAADHPNVACIALLSPGLNYFGNMPTEPALKKYGERPLFMVAAEDDKESADSVNKLIAAGNNVKYGAKIYPAGGHGTALFKVGAADALEAFFMERFELSDRK